MYFFKDGYEYKIDKFSNFKYLVKEHKYFKIAEPLFNYFKDKECALHIYKNCLGNYDENLEFRFIFEEINVSQEEIEALKILGQHNSVKMNREVCIIELIFKYEDKSIIDSCDSIHFSIKSFNYFGYYEEFKKTNTGFYREKKDLDFKIMFNNPDEIFFCAYSKCYKANMCSIYSFYNVYIDVLKKYSRRFVRGMFKYLENGFNTKIYSDLLREIRDINKCYCSITISELKNYRTKKELFYGKYNKVLKDVVIPKKYFNTHSFLNDYYIILFLKTFGKNLINIVVYDDKYLLLSQKSNKKNQVFNILDKILSKKYGDFDPIKCDVVNMLRHLPARKRKKALLDTDILCSKEKLKNYHDRLIDMFNEKDIRKMYLFLNKKDYELQKDKQIYEELSKRLPENWHMFSNEKELIHESNIMHNCIKTYRSIMLNADCGLFWGEKNGRRYNAEIVYDKKKEKYIIFQLYGFNNCKPVKGDVSDFIKSINNINKEIKEKKEIG